jgi:hypothetical protein
MYFIDVLVLVPEAVWSIDKDEVLFAVVHHLANIIKVNVLEESENREHVEGISRTSD